MKVVVFHVAVHFRYIGYFGVYESMHRDLEVYEGVSETKPLSAASSRSFLASLSLSSFGYL